VLNVTIVELCAAYSFTYVTFSKLRESKSARVRDSKQSASAKVRDNKQSVSASTR
jgi:hypothetical protein